MPSPRTVVAMYCHPVRGAVHRRTGGLYTGAEIDQDVFAVAVGPDADVAVHTVVVEPTVVGVPVTCPVDEFNVNPGGSVDAE